MILIISVAEIRPARGECAHRSGPRGQCARAASQCAAATGQCARAQRSAQQPYSGVRQPPTPRLRRAQPSPPEPSPVRRGLQASAQRRRACFRSAPKCAQARGDSAAPGSMRQGFLAQCAGPHVGSSAERRASGPLCQCARPLSQCVPGPRRSAPGPSGPCRAHSPLAGLISAPEIISLPALNWALK